MQLNELFYKVVFDGYLFIPYFIVQHNGMHNVQTRYFSWFLSDSFGFQPHWPVIKSALLIVVMTL